MFIVLLSNIVNVSNHTKCISLSNQKCMIQLTLTNLRHNEYSQEFHFYLFVVKLDTCFGSCNSFIDLSNKVCIPNKIEENVTQINAGITINVDVSVKNVMHVKKIIFGMLIHVVVKMENN